jgi:signal transduction histidine kinase/ActR/RegA family two-component response regulator
MSQAAELGDAGYVVVSRSPRAYLARHATALLIVLVLLGASVLGGLTARRFVQDQERRLLTQRTTELAAFLASSLTGIRTSLISIGTVAASSGRDSAVLPKIAGTALSATTSITVAQRNSAGFHRIAHLGADTSPATQLNVSQQRLAQRALTSADLVTSVVSANTTTQFLIAVKVPAPVPTVVLWQSPILPTRAAPASATSPYRDLNVAVYASSTADPKSLLLISGALPSRADRPVQRAVPIGSDTWLLLTAPRQNLVGSFAANFPWTITLVGALLSIVLAILVDVLTRRRAYAYKLVQRRTSTLQQAQASAEAANLAKSEFLSRMSHELRTPLNAVLGFSQLLELDDLTPDQKESVSQITKGGRHLLNLINEVLDIAHIEAGKLSLSPEAVLVSELIAESVDLMRPLAQERSLHLLNPDAHHCDKFIFTDRQRVKQILLNLLSNAIKYNRQGGSISISCTEFATDRLRIQVTDTGPGIHQDHLPLLFTPFERLGAEQTTVEGTGIGLALSFKLAEALGGTLGVDSTLGHGSTFWIEFPLVEGPVDRYHRLHPPPELAPAPEASSTRAKILYIEDNLSNLKLVERVLTQRPQVELIAAMQGRLGLELAREHQPVLVLLDLNLADLAGDQVLQRLRDNPSTAGIPVVIVSADAMPRNAQRLLSAGASGYLTKPIDVPELLHVVDNALAAATPAPLGAH